MKLVKYTICTNGFDEVIYCASGTKIDDKNSNLLGFFLNKPVLSNNSMKRDVLQKSAPMRPHINRVVKDSNTGDKFLCLNGKKLKILPPSKVPSGMMNLKVVNKNSIIHMNSQEVNISEVSDRNRTGLMLEKRDLVNCNIDKINTVNTDKIIRISEVKMSQECDTESINSRSISPHKLDKFVKLKPVNMQALDLSKDSIITNIKTEILEPTKPATVEAGVQTDEVIILEDILLDTPFNLNFFDEFGLDLPMPDLPGPSTIDSRKQNVSPAVKLFTELRSALQPDDQGNMPIHVGVLVYDLKAVKRSWMILKSLGQHIDLQNTAGQTALQLAVLHNASREIISYLISEGANVNQTDSDGNYIVHLALECQTTSPLLVVLEHDDVNINPYNNEGVTPLMVCCLNKLCEFAEILLDHGADINIRDQISGRTALFHAAERHDVQMVKLLLSYKADTKIKNFFGISPHDAMYEIDEMPDQIKSSILGKLWKKRSYDYPNENKIKKRQIRTIELKTYSKYQKIAKDIKIMKVT